MKLLNCLDCHDIIALCKVERVCFCGKSKGIIDNKEFAIVSGNSRILGMRNPDYFYSIASKNTKENFNWFVIEPQK